MRYFLFLLLPLSANAQIGIGHSVPLWGKSSHGIEISYSLDYFTLHIFQNHHKDYVYPDQIHVNSKTSTYGVSYTPIRYRNLFLGGIITADNFPTYHATSLNFYVGFDIHIGKLSIRYAHISNGFGMFHDQNLGFDSVKFRFNI